MSPVAPHPQTSAPTRAPARAARSRALVLALGEAIEARDCGRAAELAWHLYHDRLLGFFVRRSVSRSDAEELVQEVFVRMVTRWDTFQGGDLHAWLFAIARYCWLTSRNNYRRDQRNRRAEAWDPGRLVDPRDLEAREELAKVLEAVGGMEPEDREVFEATWRDGCSCEEVVERLRDRFGFRTTPAAVRTRRYRIRLAVVAHLDGASGTS